MIDRIGTTRKYIVDKLQIATSDLAMNIDDSEDEILHATTSSMAEYIHVLESLWLKLADPDPNTITIRLYIGFRGALTLVRSFTINHANYTNYFNLLDMFDMYKIISKEIRITGQNDAAAAVALTGEAAFSSYVYY